MDDQVQVNSFKQILAEGARKQSDKFWKDHELARTMFDRSEVVFNEIMPLFPNLNVVDYQISYGAGDVHLSLPRNVHLMNQFKEGLQEIRATHEVTEEDNSASNGNYTYRIRSLNQMDFLYVMFSPSMPGSSCVLNQIGTKVKKYEMPVYEVTCPEGVEWTPEVVSE